MLSWNGVKSKAVALVKAHAVGVVVWIHPQSCVGFPVAQSNPDLDPKGSWIVPSCFART